MIHGMAYANTFLSLEGKEGLVIHLLAFNVGIEVAQLLVVAIVLLSSYILFIIKSFAVVVVRILSIIILTVSLKNGI